jgi:uncharacterized membrane-anchored protein
MQKSKWILVIFVVMVLAQWLVPAQMIYGSNEVLKRGVAMKFKCAPIDPNDPFRGKYIVLDFDMARYIIYTAHDFKIGQEVYLEIGEDSLGFAQIEKIHTAPPSANKVFLRAAIDYISYETGLNGYNENNKIYEISFDLPFRRFYLEETKAPRAEDLYREGMSDTTGNTYGLVYLLKGEARIKDVFIRDTSIYELLKK